MVSTLEKATSVPPASLEAQRAARTGGPRHYHLLWDEDLEDLRPVFEAIRDRRSEVLRFWYDQYVLHFGDSRSLSEAEFLRIFEPALLRDQTELINKDMDRYAEGVRRLGEMLAEHHVPIEEIIASLNLFEEAAQSVFPETASPAINIYAKFDKLSHIRIILLVEAYSRSQAAAAGARIRALEREAAQLPREVRSRFHGLVGASRVMRALYERVEAAGQTRGTVLIVGESGTGKELVARAIHECGPTPEAAFVALNCAAIPKDLIESELFGYKRGAFSGATTEYLGLFRAAQGGTLFLDEVTEMSADTQSKLLRAIQERTVRPVGSTREVPVDVRLIASTNRDPEEMLRAGVLRDDLYYRLQASVIRIPALRERLDDVPLLVEHFITLFNERLGRAVPVAAVEDEALTAMQRYNWPGNVRELSNAIESAFTFGRSPTIRLEDLPQAISRHKAYDAPAILPPDRPGTFAEVERDLIRRALESSNGNKVRAAKLLGISRKKLYAKIAKYRLL